MTLAFSAEDMDRRTQVILGLSEDDKAERNKGIGASDANIICGGDAEKIIHLWRVKRGEAEPEDLSDILAVQMGTYTEALNIFWFEKNTGLRVVKRKEKFAHPKYPFVVARPEGVIQSTTDVLECKHVGPFNYSLETIRQRYLPQLAIQMACCGSDKAYLSVFSGNSKWEYDVIERDPIYEQEVLVAVKRFWECVETGEPPVDLPEAHAPIPVALMRKVDLSTSNVWCAAEAQYVENEAQSKLFESAKKTLKELVEADVSEATGRLVKVKRSVSGSLTLSRVRGGKS